MEITQLTPLIERLLGFLDLLLRSVGPRPPRQNCWGRPMPAYEKPLFKPAFARLTRMRKEVARLLDRIARGVALTRKPRARRAAAEPSPAGAAPSAGDASAGVSGSGVANTGMADAEASATPAPAGEAPADPPKPTRAPSPFPRKYGWLATLLSGFPFASCREIRALLTSDEMAQVFLAYPQFADKLRPLCRMIAIPPAALRPRRPGEPEPVRKPRKPREKKKPTKRDIYLADKAKILARKAQGWMADAPGRPLELVILSEIYRKPSLRTRK